MSLDIDLYYDQPETEFEKAVKLLRENRLQKAANEIEWRNDPEKQGPVFSANITHNLGAMAKEAGIYTTLWRPEEAGIVYAKEMIKPLTDGLEKLESDEAHFKQFNAKNGWGLYEHFVPFVRNVLQACIKHQDAKVRVCR